MAKTHETIPGSNGSIALKRSWLRPRMTIYGGPFAYCPKGMFGVCLLERNNTRAQASISMPIEDFSVPHQTPEEIQRALIITLEELLEGRPIYAGCLGGYGRTGIYLSLLMKSLGERDPIAFVREHYNSRAVETRAQENWIRAFNVKPVRRWLHRALVRRLFSIRRFRPKSELRAA